MKNSMCKLENHYLHYLPPQTLWKYSKTHQEDELTSHYLNQQQNFCVNRDLKQNGNDQHNMTMKNNILVEIEKKKNPCAISYPKES